MLPEKWFIERNQENHKIINEWSNKKKGVGHNACLPCTAYFFSDRPYTDRKASTIGYKEISFEDFKTWVLGMDEATEEERETNYEIF